MKLGIVVDTDTRATKQEFSSLRTEVKKQADLLGDDWESAAGRVEDALREAGARDDLIQAARKIGQQGPTEIEKMRTALREVGDAGHTAATDIQDSLDRIDLTLAQDKFDNFKGELRANAVESGAEVVRGLADGINGEDAKSALDGAVDILFQTGAATGGAAGAGLMGAGLGLSVISGIINQINAGKAQVEAAANAIFEDLKTTGADYVSESLILKEVDSIITENGKHLAQARTIAEQSGASLSTVLRGMSGDTEAAATVTQGLADAQSDLQTKVDSASEHLRTYEDDVNDLDLQSVNDATRLWNDRLTESEAALDGAKQKIDTYRAAVDQGRSSLATARDEIDKLTERLKDPLSGTFRIDWDRQNREELLGYLTNTETLIRNITGDKTLHISRGLGGGGGQVL